MAYPVINRGVGKQQLFSSEDEYLRVLRSFILQRGEEHLVFVLAFGTNGMIVLDALQAFGNGLAS